MAQRPPVTFLVCGLLAALLVGACSAQSPGTTGSPTAATPSPVAPTPSPTPSATPTPTPKPTQPPETLVYYDLATRIISVGDATPVKETRLTLTFRALRPGTEAAGVDRFAGPEIRHSPELTADSPVSLAPGDYEATSLTFPAAALGGDLDTTIDLVNGAGDQLHGPTLTVPSTGCVYLGAIMFTFVRVAPGDAAKQVELVKKVASGAAAQLTLDINGSLVWFVNDPDSITVSADKAMQTASGAGACDIKQWKDPVPAS